MDAPGSIPTAARLGAVALVVALAGCGARGLDPSAPARDLATISGSPVAAAQASIAGEFAADYLHDAHFTSLVVEVAAPAGRDLAPAVLDLLGDRLVERCRKPDGVQVVLGDAIPLAEFPPVLSDADLAAIEDAHRHAYSDLATKTAAMFVLCVPGISTDASPGAPTLATSYRGGSIAVFLDAASQGPNLYVTSDEVVGTSLVHEAGHLLGLVNRGVPMVVPHEDPAHPFHDTDPASVMFWMVLVPRVSPNLGDANFAQFGAACIEDLKAFGGR